MQHATLMDVFNAGARAASPFIQYETDRLKAQNDLHLKAIAATSVTELENKIRDNPFDGNFGQSNANAPPDENNSPYVAKLQQFAEELYDKAADENNSPYFQKNIKAMKAQAMESMRRRALEAEDAYRVKQEGVHRRQNIQGYVDTLPPEAAIAAIDIRIKLSASRDAGFDPQQQQQERQAAYTALYAKHAQEAVERVEDVSQLDAVIKAVNIKFAEVMPKEKVPVYDGQGNETATEERDWTFEGREKWEQTLIKQRTNQIQAKHGEKIETAQGTFERYIASGDLEGAIAFAKPEAAKLNRYYNSKNQEYANLSNEQRNQYGPYLDFSRLEAILEKEKDKKKAALVAMIPFNPEMFIDPQINGDGTVTTGYELVGYDQDGQPQMKPIQTRYETLLDARNGYIDLERQAFEYQNQGKPQILVSTGWAIKEGELLRDFDDAVLTRMGKLDPQFRAYYTAYMKTDTWILPGTKDNPNPYYNKEVERFSDAQRDQYVQDRFNFATELLMSGGISDPVKMYERMRFFASEEITKLLQWRSTPSDEGEKIKKLAEFSAEAMSEKAEDVVFTISRKDDTALALGIPEGQQQAVWMGNLRWRSEAQEAAAKKVQQEELRKTAELLGILPSDLNPGWMRSERQPNDVIAKGVFVKVSEKTIETYRMNYDHHANQFVEIYDAETKTWTEVPQTRSKRPQTKREQLDEYIKRLNEEQGGVIPQF